jgi:uncharacterized protein YaeQ
MALSPVRFEYRVALSNVDRGRELAETVIASRHPSETQRRLTLRLLAWCLVNEERLTFGPGLSTPDTPDLWAHDLTGRLLTWVECGTALADRLRKAQQHNPGLGVHVVLDDERRAAQLLAELKESRLPRAASPPSLWIVDAALVAKLAEREERRQRWSVTVVGDHLYVDADGLTVDGPVARTEASARS